MNHPAIRFDAASAGALAEAFETVTSLVLELDDQRHESLADSSLYAAGLAQLVEALKQAQGSKGDRESVDLSKAELTELGSYGFDLLEGLRRCIVGTPAAVVDPSLEQLQIPLALWIVRHGGEWNEWDVLTNALASQANALHEPTHLRRLCEIMDELITAAPASLAADLESLEPSRPWRVLHLNRAIVATRAFDVEAMESAFDALVERLPEDADAFFQEGVQHARKMGAPVEVLTCLERYRGRVQHPTTH